MVEDSERVNVARTSQSLTDAGLRGLNYPYARSWVPDWELRWAGNQLGEVLDLELTECRRLPEVTTPAGGTFKGPHLS